MIIKCLTCPLASLCFLIIFLTDSVDGCGHFIPKAIDIHHVYVEGNRRERRDNEATHHNIRIHATYDESVHQLPADKQAFIKNSVMEEAITYWEGALKTRRLSKPLLLARSCTDKQLFRSDSEDISDRQTYCVDSCSSQTMCGDSVVPEHHLQGCRMFDTFNEVYIKENSPSTGIEDADYLLYVGASNTSRCESSIAYATYCQLEVEYDRPIAGFINICPHSISTHEAQLELAVAKIKHEILHALGFSVSLYGFYRDGEGNPLTAREKIGNRPRLGADLNYIYSDKVVRTVWRHNWVTSSGPINWPVDMMVTPKVTAEVRRHFNCSTLEGAELENQGPSGTRLTHWEKRLFENEVMTGIYTQNPVVSRITLALMEDTGWYITNYSYAQTLEWGSNLGCDFAMKSCIYWIKSKQSMSTQAAIVIAETEENTVVSNEPTHPYCTEMKSTPLRTQCTTQRSALSICNMHQYPTDIPNNYRFSDVNPRLGGIVALADYCPYLQEFNWRKEGEFVRGSDCTLSSNTPHVDTNLAIEYYGSDSRCFDQTRPFQMSRCSETYTSNNYGSGCYQYKCIQGKGLHIYVAGAEFRCYKEGQLLEIRVTTDISYFNGILVCPSCTSICQDGVESCPPDAEPPEVSRREAKSSIPCLSSASFYTSNMVYIVIYKVVLVTIIGSLNGSYTISDSILL